MKTIHIIFDYGHGNNCPGKCSPDKSFYEWQFNREIGKEVALRLQAKGYTVHEIWTQDHEPLSTPGKLCNKAQINAALNWRWKEVNKLCAQYGTSNCIMVSFHANAAGGDGKWHDASGFCSMVGLKASANSKRLAKCIYDEAANRNLQGNRYVPEGHYWPQSLAMCDRTLCPAVLTESLFYDNKGDLAILKSAEGKERIVQAHVDGIINYLNA
ncbi:N-acetylmuramoyl-L-alanine amidase [uncultured Duncaniella sp.]|jgi:N-acetylmuramoyl-L-alanine amidase|uniref:N-acetylmuramoyl-L-alanine amidase n=1 Tax=uncultured Duncaniella sp. TaxID=2768039 RepID=UPI0026332825|nr:N-acetylmuramoyl-L-alanine amidase [uncultured Duncaniella sp.]